MTELIKKENQFYVNLYSIDFANIYFFIIAKFYFSFFRVEAMKKIQSYLKNGDIEDAVGLLRSARY